MTLHQWRQQRFARWAARQQHRYQARRWAWTEGFHLRRRVAELERSQGQLEAALERVQARLQSVELAVFLGSPPEPASQPEASPPQAVPVEFPAPVAALPLSSGPDPVAAVKVAPSQQLVVALAPVPQPPQREPAAQA